MKDSKTCDAVIAHPGHELLFHSLNALCLFVWPLNSVFVFDVGYVSDSMNVYVIVAVVGGLPMCLLLTLAMHS